jgi:uncharacterized protein
MDGFIIMMYETLRSDLKEAMLKKDSTRTATLRLVLAAVKDREIATRSGSSDDVLEVSDETVFEILSKMRKQRIDSIAMYEEAGRLDLAESESFEKEIIESYLPQQLSLAEIETVIRLRIQDLKAEGLRDMGRIMNSLKETHAGKMNFAQAGLIVKKCLTS